MTLPHKRREKLRRMIASIIGLALALTMIAPTSLSARTLTLDDALQIAFENSPSIRQAQNSLESAQASLDAEEASLKSQFRFDLTPISIEKGQAFFGLTQERYTEETKSSSARFSVNQRIKWTDAVLTLSNNFDW